MKNSHSKKLVLMTALILVFATLFCACGKSKEATTTADFISKAEASGMKTQKSNAFGDYKEGTIAYVQSGFTVAWQVEFYVMDSNEDAQYTFEQNKTVFEGRSGTASSFSLGSKETYEKTGEGKYMYLSRIDNTLLYVDVKEEYKNDAKAFIRELGY